MFDSILSIILIILFSLFPLLLWNYATLYLRDHAWNRGRFFAGIVGGVISLSLILLSERGLHTTGYERIWAVIGVFVILGIIASIVIHYGSRYTRGFLRNILFLHIFLFALILYSGEWISEYITFDTRYFSFIAGMSGILIAACLEEGVKHISSIGLSARDFRFSRRDFLLFTFFVTLGFVVGENILYFIGIYQEGLSSVFLTGIYRIFFALPLHVFAASICVVFWWKALSYGVFSWRYIVLFMGGFFSATLVHSLYNLLISGGHFLALIVLAGFGYMSFTQWIISLDPEEKKI